MPLPTAAKMTNAGSSARMFASTVVTLGCAFLLLMAAGIGVVVAIIVLVVLIAGPWVSSAITNQFNTVAGTLGNGISKGSWESGGTGGGNGSLTDADIVDPVHGIAFAVYSEDDHSLMFYKRRGVPESVICSTAAA